MSGSASPSYYLWGLPYGNDHQCMEPTAHSSCKKRAHSFFKGDKGPYYRCRKCTVKFLDQRPDFKFIPNPLR